MTLEFVDLRRLDGNLFGRHLQRHQFFADFFERRVVVSRARLRLKQHDGPNVFAAGRLFLARPGLPVACAESARPR